MKYLLTRAAIRQAIHDVFSSNGEKWAVVGFVGYSALDQLPQGIENLHVVCWPRAGATSPDGVRRLLKAGIQVYFCDSLHSKVYWSNDHGLVVGSANLSENALGNSYQHEFAVHLPNGSFDIRDLLGSLQYIKVDERSLHTLDAAHAAAKTREPDSDTPTVLQPSFAGACCLPIPRKWKLISWCQPWQDTSSIKAAVYETYGARRWENDNHVDAKIYPDKKAFEVGDFVVQVKTDCRTGLIARSNAKWLRVELITQQSRWPTLVQVAPEEDGATPPFLIDGDFRRKLRHEFNVCKWKEIVDEQGFVRTAFIARLLAQHP